MESREFQRRLAVQLPPATLTVGQFCLTHNISRALLYLLLRNGRGPRVMKAGRRTLISAEAAADWRRAMETASAEDL